MHKSVDRVEQAIASELVGDILAKGLAITVYNGGVEPEVNRADTFDAAWNAMGESDQDELIIYDAVEQARVGWVLLVYGNGCDLISDYTANAATEALIKGASAVADSIENTSENWKLVRAD